jgi:hypothetical protein
MILSASVQKQYRLPARPLKLPDHLLGLIAVLADDQVDVVGHQGARVARVPLRPDHLLEGVGDHPDVARGERQERVAEQVFARS